MATALIQFSAWDRNYFKLPADLVLKINDWVMVETDFGPELGQVIEINGNGDIEKTGAEDIKSIARLANREEIEEFNGFNGQPEKEKAISHCQKIIKRHNLEMKLVDCSFSFDGQKITFAFIADGRVDFREAVKDLIKFFKKSVRLHQLGVRDEAKIAGDSGSCGLGLCCRQYLKKLGNVSSELAGAQQVAHRGAERLSGVCGRLKCCLAYEKELYEELAKKLPAVGTRVRTKHGRGVVVGWRTLRGSVDVKIDKEKERDDDLIVEVPIA